MVVGLPGSHENTEGLQARTFTALRYRGPGTDLTIGLHEGTRWLSGSRPTSAPTPGRRLGEVALVDGTSEVGKTGVVFGNTLFDENGTEVLEYSAENGEPINVVSIPVTLLSE